MQFFHKDNILNFGLASNTCSMSVGNSMQAKSFIIIMIALLIQRYQGLTKYLSAIYLILVFLGLVYWTDHHCWDKFLYARGAVWLATLKLWIKHPIVGWGLGSYKVLFYNLAHGKFELEGCWYQAHNEYLQYLFEQGLIGLGLLVGLTINLFKKCKGLALLGAILLLYPLLFQFPTHQPSAIPLLLLFIVAIERNPYGCITK
jgi:hypothetical protein